MDYANALAALFLNPYVKPPIVVGISGSWGMGKSSLMVQTESVLLTTAAQMALLPRSKLSRSAGKLPEIKKFVLTTKGKKKSEEMKRQVKHEQEGNKNISLSMMDKIQSWVKNSDAKAEKRHDEEDEEDEEDSLWKFLNNYEVKHRKIFKSLAAMDSRDMFTTTPKENKDNQKSDSKSVWNVVKKFRTNVQQSQTSAQPSKADSLEEGSIQAFLTEQGSVPAILTVQYNAWKYRNETEALAGMAVAITKDLEGIMTQAQWLSTCWRNTWKNKKYHIWMEIFFPCLLALVLTCTFALIVWLMLDRFKFKDRVIAKYACLPAGIVIIVWTLTKSTMSILKPVSTRLINYISFPDHTDKLGYQERVISDIKFLKDEIGKKPHMVFAAISQILTTIAALWLLITEWWVASLFSHRAFLEKRMTTPEVAPASGTNLRIIVFIDDLDRCQESVILQVLSAINLVLAVCEISVVMGIDKGLIERAIIKKYGDMRTNKSFRDNQELADSYLQKIIQLPLDLPDPSREQSRKFLEGQLGVFQNPTEGTESETKMDTRRTKILSRKISMPDARNSRESRVGDNAGAEIGPENNLYRQVAIDMQIGTEIRREDPIETLEATTNLPVETRREDDAGISPVDQTRKKAPPETDATRGNKNSRFTISIREMLFVRYSEGEQDAFRYFQTLATGWRKNPREWKRLLIYHRLVWNILYITKEAKDLAGWQAQLITWIFICWEWQENVNYVVQNWNSIGVLKSSGSTTPSLQMIVEHFMERENNENMQMTPASHEGKETKGKKIETESSNIEQIKLEEVAEYDLVREDAATPQEKKKGKKNKKKKKKQEIRESSKKGAGLEKMEDAISDQFVTLEKALRKELDELKKEMKDLKDQVQKQHRKKNEKREEEKRLKRKSWERLRLALLKYDVPMEAIKVFQRFRFLCKSGHLSWPLSTGEGITST